MEILLTLTYVAICVMPSSRFSEFRSINGRLRQQRSAASSALSLLFITMAYNHPFSTNARIYFTVTPILPAVRGRVIEVPVANRTNQHLEAGEVLFKIDPKPYEYIVEEKRAGLADAEANVAQLKASVDQASAATAKARAQLQLAQENYDGSLNCSRRTSSRRPHWTPRRANRDASKQATAEAVAAEDRARQAYGAIVDGEHSAIVDYAMSLPMLEYNLDQTTVERLSAALSPSWRCGQACMWCRRPSVQP